jgi:hypothetical protein
MSFLSALDPLLRDLCATDLWTTSTSTSLDHPLDHLVEHDHEDD